MSINCPDPALDRILVADAAERHGGGYHAEVTILLGIWADTPDAILNAVNECYGNAISDGDDYTVGMFGLTEVCITQVPA